MALPTPSQQRAFVRAVCRLAGLSAARVSAPLPTVGGANLVWRARTDRGPVVIKARVDRREGVSDEARALARGTPAGAPRVLYAGDFAARLEQVSSRPSRAVARDLRALDIALGGSLVLEALPGRRPPAGPVTMAALGGLVAALHRRSPGRLGPLRSGGHPGAVWRRVHDLAAWTGPALAPPTRRRLGRVLRDLEQDHDTKALVKAPPRLCHGDLRLHNVVAHRGALRLIDFEHAGAGDPALDLALFLVRERLSVVDQVVFLDAYQGGRGPGRKVVDRAIQWRGLAAMLGALAGLQALLAVQAGAPSVGGARGYAQFHRARVEDDLEAVLGQRPRWAPAPRAPGRGGTKKRRRGEVVTVDGPAGSGSSTLVTAAAARFGLGHINLGAGYRAAAHLALQKDWDPARPDDVARLVRSLRRRRLRLAQGIAVVGEDPLDGRLNLIGVEKTVAAWATVPGVRDWVQAAARDAAGRGGVIIEGRVAGTVIAPDAAVRVYVDADEAVRAARIQERLGRDVPVRTVRGWVRRRDAHDRSRAVDPFVVPAGAARIDTTTKSARRCIEALCQLIEGHAR